MQLKKYQNDTLAVIKKFFDALDTKTPSEAYASVTSSVDMIARLGNLRHYEPLGGSRSRATEMGGSRSCATAGDTDARERVPPGCPRRLHQGADGRRTFGQAASELAEGLRKKGFDETEAAAAIVMQPDLGLKDDEDEEDGLFNQPGTLGLAYYKNKVELCIG